MTMGIQALHAREQPERTDVNRLRVVDFQSRRGPELFGLARRLGLTADEADDAVQETLLRMWVALDGASEIVDVDAWSFRVLYRLCMDQHRWRRRVRIIADRIGSAVSPGAGTGIAERLALWEAVDLLPERQRAVVYLRYRADLSFDQIGSVLGIRPVSARSHCSRALDRLESMLSREDFS